MGNKVGIRWWEYKVKKIGSGASPFLSFGYFLCQIELVLRCLYVLGSLVICVWVFGSVNQSLLLGPVLPDRTLDRLPHRRLQ